MMRLFVGLSLPETVRERLAMMRGGIPGATWVPAENLHLTLRFIGEVDEATAADIDTELERVSAPGFDLTLSGMGIFGQGRQARTLWVGVTDTPALLHVHAKVDRAVVAAGCAAESRKYSPHVTIARLKTPDLARLDRFCGEHAGFAHPSIPVSAFHLFESRLGRTGSTYEIVRGYPLDRGLS